MDLKLFFNSKKLKLAILILYIANALIIVLQHYFLINSWNNFKIFYTAFGHLKANLNLHSFYPKEYFDQFLYGPPTAVWLGLFSWMPPLIAMFVWCLFTTLVVWFAIYTFPKISLATKNKIALFIFLELSGSVNNLQTNHLLAGILVFNFILLEKNKIWQNNIITAISFFTKGISGAGVFLILFYKPIFKNSIKFLISFILIGMLPALIVGLHQLPRLYNQWIVNLTEDHAVNYGVSLIGFLQSNFIPNLNAYIIQLFGIIILATVLLFIKFKKTDCFTWRLFAMNYILIWLVLFNNAGESCGYIFAALGIAFWFFTQAKSKINSILIYSVIVFTMLASSDLCPRKIGLWYLEHSFKALPVILIWIKMHYELFFDKTDRKLEYE